MKKTRFLLDVFPAIFSLLALVTGASASTIEVIKSDGTVLNFTPAQNTDAARGTALIAAVSAVNALAMANADEAGVQIVLGPGTYDLNSTECATAFSGLYCLRLRGNHIVLRGAGQDLTTIRAQNGSNFDRYLVFGHISATKAPVGITVQDLTVDANLAGQTGAERQGMGLLIYGSHHRVQRCHFIHWGNGPVPTEVFICSLNTSGGANGGFDLGMGTDNVIEDCLADQAANSRYATVFTIAGFNVPAEFRTSVGNGWLTDSAIRRCVVRNVTSTGGALHAFALGWCADSVVEDCRAENLSGAVDVSGFYNDTGSLINLTIRNNQFLNMPIGVNLRQTEAGTAAIRPTVIGNTIVGNNAATGFGIRMDTYVVNSWIANALINSNSMRNVPIGIQLVPNPNGPITNYRARFNVIDAATPFSVAGTTGTQFGNQTPTGSIIIVTTRTDELDPVGTAGSGESLREAVRDVPDGGTIVFDSAVFGGAATNTITLGSEIIVAKNITFDASNVPAGVMITGNHAKRILSINSGQTVSLQRLTLSGGNGTGATQSGEGGAIYNQGALTVTRCTFSENSANIGGSIANTGTLTLAHCTLSGNSASGNGGAIRNSGLLSLTHCTLSGNSAAGSGGAIENAGALTLTNSIVSGNTASGDGADIVNGGNVTRAGANLVKVLTPVGAGTEGGPVANPSDPLLAPLGRYGGPTPTMALRAGSPARDAAIISTATADQRDSPIVGAADIGAYEAGASDNFAAWALENTGTNLAIDSELDADGFSAGLEYALRRNPLLPDAAIVPSMELGDGGNCVLSFPYRAAAHDLRYTLQRSTNLGSANGWLDIFRFDTSTGITTENGVSGAEDGGTETIAVSDPIGAAEAFWRLKIDFLQ
ncbi:MAG TPA: right-handed parallel beta-helix repeat-containing protein [Chthoniobacteraceae bacterium]|nr:right-handed parallel beta-helix repeat-containing protein [Chthoniobacteraceae bacterium]